ncbi:MAG: potassium channel family protein, partial [Sciscionella sp.]
SRLRSVAAAALSQARPHDPTTRMLLIGLAGLLTTLGADWAISASALGAPPARALYEAARVVATVGPGNPDQHAPAWYLAFASSSMLATIGLTALVTAAVVNRLHSARSVALFGARTLPTRDHIVVIGLGQVGLRLCIQLRELGIPVLAIERDPRAVNLRLAKKAKVPVLVAHAEDRATLQRLRLHHARALAAMGADDLDNIEVAIAALAVHPTLRIVLRAGEGDIIAETRSLFHIGEVRDVSALTSFALTRSLLGHDHGTVYPLGDRIASYPAAAAATLRCACTFDHERARPSPPEMREGTTAGAADRSSRRE